MNTWTCDRFSERGLPTSWSSPIESGVLDELLGRLLDAVEEGPPHRLTLAGVVVEELRDQLIGRFAGREQSVAQRGAVNVVRFRLARRQRLG